MSIKNWLITGDTHREFSRFKEYDEKYNNSKTAVIILGDAGLNYMMNTKDNEIKNHLTNKYKFIIYCVKGNHEGRPQNVKNMLHVYDENVNGYIWIQSEYPTIRYFDEYGIYKINGMRTAIIGGAYSVDKYYRLSTGNKWFADEELSDEEMDDCLKLMMGQHFDLVLTHTCPLSYEPTDLFLKEVDQSSVSKRMENFLYKLSNNIHWDIWCFGHFHADRIEAPYVEQYFRDTEELSAIVSRWQKYDTTGKLDWWLTCGPNFGGN